MLPVQSHHGDFDLFTSSAGNSLIPVLESNSTANAALWQSRNPSINTLLMCVLVGIFNLEGCLYFGSIAVITI
ncbi:hypothetical protein BJY00DRAFT_273127 [Aspergillus carlsbadensis]|nr:hypothetical protein BJY00DRAFT_273127 [Aspergillus carlsbadensis]